MSTSVDTMKNFFNVLKLYANDTTTDGVAILDHAVKTVSHFASLQDAVNHFVYDIASVTAATGNPWQSLYQNCGIVVGEDYDFSVDTGSASGYNAGMGTVKNAQDIVPEGNVLLTQFAAPAAGSTTYHTYTGADGQTFSFNIVYPQNFLTVVDWEAVRGIFDTTAEDEMLSESEVVAQMTAQFAEASIDLTTTDQTFGYFYPITAAQVAAGIQTVATGLDNLWYTEAAKLAYDSYGLDFNGKTLHVYFGVNSHALASTGALNQIYTPAENIVMVINMEDYSVLAPDDPNGNTRISGGAYETYLDRVIAHEMIHATMGANGVAKDNMPRFFTEGVAELVHGASDYDDGSTEDLLDLATDSERLTAALTFESGTGTGDAYPAGYMFLRYLIHQSLPTQVAIGTGAVPEVFSYAGGEEIISGVASASQINTADNVRIVTAFASGNDMIVATTAGNLIVRDVRGKILNFATGTGKVYGHSYMSAEAGTIDGRGLSGYEFIAGADNVNNALIAGNDGAELWGGSYGDDELFGGNGSDNFVAGVGCGNDKIYSAAANDRITLSATLDQITGANVTSSAVTLNFSDGSTLAVAGNVGATFALSDGSTYIADQSTGQFTRTN